MTLEYDSLKAQTNLRKHGVSFAEAECVLFDPLAIHDIDPEFNRRGTLHHSGNRKLRTTLGHCLHNAGEPRP